MDRDSSEGGTAVDAAGTGDARPADAGPSADPGDEFFAVLDSDTLRAFVDVHSRGLDDLLVFVEPGHGLVARNRGGENCYWAQTEVDADDFAVFRATDVTTSVSVPALAAGLDRARPDERLSLHYGDAEGFRLGVGDDRHPIDGDDPELSEELRARDAFSTVTGDARPEIRFEIDAARFQAFAGPETAHTHVRVHSDTTDGSVSFALVGHPDGESDMAFEVPAEDLLSPPAETGWGDDEHDGMADMMASSDEELDVTDESVQEVIEIFEDTPESATSYLCTESVDPAMSPMRGPVQVLHSDGKPSTRFTYSRADGTVTVKALVSHRLDEVEGLP